MAKEIKNENEAVLDAMYSILYERQSPFTVIRQLTETFK